MKFAILGAGALGTILGAHLSRAGHEVAMIVRGERARSLQRQGLVLNGLSDIKARPTVIDDPQKLGARMSPRSDCSRSSTPDSVVPAASARSVAR